VKLGAGARPWKWVRRAAQATVVVIIGWLGYRHTLLGGGAGGSAPLDAFCPFGAIETLPSLLTTGTFLKKTAISGFIVLGAVVGATMVGRASFCGWLCPLGTVVEWVHRAARFLARVAGGIPGAGRLGKAASRWGARRARRGAWLRSERGRAWDRRLRYLRYGVLALILATTFTGGRLVFEAYDPFKAVFHFQIETALTLGVLVLLLVTSLLVERFWCRYLCPLGAVVSLGSRLSPAGVTRDSGACTDCGRCDAACGMGIDVSHVERVTSGQCSLCGDCTDACPVEGALHTTWSAPAGGGHAARRLLGAAPDRIRRGFASAGSGARPAMAVILFAAVIAGSMATGAWQTRAEAGGGAGAGSEAVVGSDHEGESLPTDGSAQATEIKGRMTVREVADAFHADPVEVLAALGAPPDTDQGLSVKAVAGTYGGSVDDLRAWLGSGVVPPAP